MPRPANPVLREQCLLDATARLLIDHGYDKTTVADVALAAGVSKGAVYLHFESKEALFDALVLREMTRFAQQWLQAVESTPEGGRIGQLFRTALKLLCENELLAALICADSRVLGSALRRPGTRLQAGRSPLARQAFVQAMQAAGAVRADLDAAVTAQILGLLSAGLVQLAAQESSDAREALLHAIADLLERAFAPTLPARSPSSKTRSRSTGESAASQAGKAIVRHLVEAGLARLQSGSPEGKGVIT
jgi:TetR/AcrR family acrAB operon transcriptional repressor